MKLRVSRKDLPLKHVMTTPRGSVSVVYAVIVELEQDGLYGFGESYEDRSIHPYRIDTMVEKIRGIEKDLAKYALADPLAFNLFVAPHFQDDNASLCAVEMAAYDLLGKLHNAPLRRMWRYRNDKPLVSSYTIGKDSMERALDKFEEVPDWPIYRVELTGRNDIPLLEELRRRTEAAIRIDVGGYWTLSQALDYLPKLERLNIESIEQPLPPGQWEESRILKENSSIPIYADETCLSIDDIGRCVGAFHGVNLRPIKFGGLQATRRAVKMAKALGLKTMIGNPIESTVAASAVAQFAPVLDQIYVDGPLQIERKLGSGLELDHGKIILPASNGTGVNHILRH